MSEKMRAGSVSSVLTKSFLCGSYIETQIQQQDYPDKFVVREK